MAFNLISTCSNLNFNSETQFTPFEVFCSTVNQFPCKCFQSLLLLRMRPRRNSYIQYTPNKGKKDDARLKTLANLEHIVIPIITSWSDIFLDKCQSRLWSDIFIDKLPVAPLK